MELMREIDRYPDHWIPDDTFGRRLLVLRKQLGLTGPQMAAVLGKGICSYPTYNNWERGVRPTKYDEVCDKIAGRLRCDPEWLRWGTQNRKVLAPLVNDADGSGQWN